MSASCPIQGQKKIKNPGDLESDKMLSIFKALYEKVKFNCLYRNDRPLIFAYSALVTDEVISNTNKAGFVNCLPSPLTVGTIE